MPGPKKQPNEERKNVTIRLPAQLVARLKHVSRLAAGHPAFATVSSICSKGISHELDVVEAILAETYKDLEPPKGGSQRRDSVRLPVINNHAPHR